MKEEFRGFTKIFVFTLKSFFVSKKWRIATVLLAAIFLLFPIVIMLIYGLSNDSEAEIYSGSIETVYVADETDGYTDLSILSTLGGEFSKITYEDCQTYEEACEKANPQAGTVVLQICYDGFEYFANIITPEWFEDDSIREHDAAMYAAFVNSNFQYILIQKSGLDAEQLAVLASPVEVNIVETSEKTENFQSDSDNEGILYEVLRYILPYLAVMILYFLVLFYGQSVAQAVIIEKTSKLMDTFLISVKPSAMIFGKVFACVSTAISQLLIWIISLIAGCLGGIVVLSIVNPEAADMVKEILKGTEVLQNIMSPIGIVVAVLIMLGGFLLYCALASIGGSLAGRQEDLQSTNILFTMILVVSFLVVLYNGSGLFSDGESFSSAWLNWIPFTAVLITPARVLLGDISIAQGVGSFIVILTFSAVIMYLAGRLYKIMALYKGNVPKPAQNLSMLKNK